MTPAFPFHVYLRKSAHWRPALAGLIAAWGVGCGELTTSPSTILITAPLGTSLAAGGTAIRLVAEISGTVPAAPSGQQPITWISRSPAVATVDAYGVVEGKSVGTSVIVAAASGAPQVSASMTITVTGPFVRLSPKSGTTAEAGGSGIRLDAQIIGTTPTPPAGEGAIAWTSLSPSIATVDGYGVVFGRFPGTAVIVATARFAPEVSAPITIKVIAPVDPRPQTHVLIGDSLVDTLSNAYGRKAIVLDLAADDVVDMALTWPAFRLNSVIDWLIDGPDVPDASLYLARHPPSAGSFHIGARGIGTTCNQYGCTVHDGPYTFRIRQAGPVMSVGGGHLVVLREGEVRTDSVWVQNVGSGPMTSQVSVNVPGVQVLTPTVLAIGGGLGGGVDPLIRQPGASSVRLRFDARQLGPGTPTSVSVGIVAPGAWTVNGASSSAMGVYMPVSVIDSVFRFIGQGLNLRALVSTPAGDMYAVRADTDFALDGASGRLSAPVAGATGVEGSPLGVYDLGLGPDGSLYFHSSEGIYRLPRTGVKVVVPLSGPPYLRGMVVVPDGSLIVARYTTLFRVAPDGKESVLATLPGSAPGPDAMVVNRVDGGLYFVRGTTLARVDLETGAYTERGTLPFTSQLLTSDANGVMYAITQSSGASQVLAITASGRVLEKFPMQRGPTGLAVSGNQLYGTDGVDLWVRRLTPP